MKKLLRKMTRPLTPKTLNQTIKDRKAQGASEMRTDQNKCVRWHLETKMQRTRFWIFGSHTIVMLRLFWVTLDELMFMVKQETLTRLTKSSQFARGFQKQRSKEVVRWLKMTLIWSMTWQQGKQMNAGYAWWRLLVKARRWNSVSFANFKAVWAAASHWGGFQAIL